MPSAAALALSMYDWSLTPSATTKVPFPVCVSVRPRAVQDRRASRTTERLTPYCCASAASELSLTPTVNSPDSMAERMALNTASVALTRTICSCPAVQLSDKFIM